MGKVTQCSPRNGLCYYLPATSERSPPSLFSPSHGEATPHCCWTHLGFEHQQRSLSTCSPCLVQTRDSPLVWAMNLWLQATPMWCKCRCPLCKELSENTEPATCKKFDSGSWGREVEFPSLSAVVGQPELLASIFRHPCLTLHRCSAFSDLQRR